MLEVVSCAFSIIHSQPRVALVARPQVRIQSAPAIAPHDSQIMPRNRTDGRASQCHPLLMDNGQLRMDNVRRCPLCIFNYPFPTPGGTGGSPTSAKPPVPPWESHPGTLLRNKFVIGRERVQAESRKRTQKGMSHVKIPMSKENSNQKSELFRFRCTTRAQHSNDKQTRFQSFSRIRPKSIKSLGFF